MVDILICFVIMLLLQLLTPFWFWIMVVPFGYNLFRVRSAGKGFGIGAISAGLLWLLSSLYFWLSGGKLIVQRVANIMQTGNSLIMILAATIIATVAGGVAGLSGTLLKKALSRK